MNQPVTHPLIGAERVNGAEVYGEGGHKLGRIEDVAIDKVSGRVAYAILSFGGLLGIGERYFPVPWGILKYDIDRRGYVVPLDEDSVKKAPSFEPKSLSGWTDAHTRESVFRYYAPYGVAPYWM